MVEYVRARILLAEFFYPQRIFAPPRVRARATDKIGAPANKLLWPTRYPPSETTVGNAQSAVMGMINVAALKRGVLRETLLLPKTSLTIFTPKHVPSRLVLRCTDILYEWQKTQLPKENTFVLHDGPPYANGTLHMGHALNKILKDMVGRFQVLSGRRLSYIPGWDCHGLPIELKALQNLIANPIPGRSKKKGDPVQPSVAAELGKSMDPTVIRKLARKLAKETVGEQKAAFKSWCVMADWGNAYETMNKDYEIEQLGVFKEMLRKDLIYRRFKPVYWSPSSGSALAEAELEYNKEHISTAAFVKFPIEGFSKFGLGKRFPTDLSAVVWTTTPWTIPANKAIAVHPELEYSVLKTERHGHLLAASSRVQALEEHIREVLEVVETGITGEELVGLEYTHPLLASGAPLQPIIAADFVTADSGTGLVHCAPGHGMDDYLVCLKHKIAPFSPVNSDGEFTEEVLPFGSDLPGLKVVGQGAKQVITLLMKSKSLLGRPEKYKHKYPYDWRNKLPVIIRATAQWFADVDGIKTSAVKSLENVKFFPSAGNLRLTSFVQGRSEWCISRQRAWGVPIPVLYEVETGEPLLTVESVGHIISVIERKGIDAWWNDEADNIDWIPKVFRDGKKWARGTETMDVWFDSGTSWATLKQRIGEREEGKPLADLYLEGSDQHRGWFQSSLLTSIASEGKAPFGTVLTHGFCLDERGKKMSKSAGNVVLPDDVIDVVIPKGGKKDKKTGGLNALRLWAACSDYTKDVVIGDKILEYIHECLRKMRGTARFLIGNLDDWDGVEVPYEKLTKIDQYALAQMCRVNEVTKEAYENMQFSKAVNAIVVYTSTELSAFYLDVVKDRVYSNPAGSLSRRSVQTVMYHLLMNYLSMLAPIVPILAEEIWNHTPETITKGVISPAMMGWYKCGKGWDDRVLMTEFRPLEEVSSVVKTSIEEAKMSEKIKVNLQTSVSIVVPEGSKAKLLLDKYADELAQLFIVTSVDVETTFLESESWEYVKNMRLVGDECTVVVRPAKGHKCIRCWVYAAEEEGGICGRCEDTLKNLPEEEYDALFDPRYV